MNLLPMDIVLLGYLVEHGGAVPACGIPAKLFRGEIPPDAPSLIEAGAIEACGNDIRITDAGRYALAVSSLPPHEQREG